MKCIILSVLLAIGGCHGDQQSPASAVDPASDPLINRVWLHADAADMPGEKLIFLSDGTLVQDSCWETYRLSKWRREAGNRLAWSEDSMEIQAHVKSLDSKDLVLEFLLVSQTEERHYVPASVPYVCPDMKR